MIDAVEALPTIPGLMMALLLTTATVCGVLALTVVGERVIRTIVNDRQKKRRDRVRPVLLDIIDGNTSFAFSRADTRALTRLAAHTATQVRGDDRAALTTWLVTQQFHRECLAHMKSPFALTRARALDRFAPLAELAPVSVERMLTDRDARVRSLAAQVIGRAGLSSLVPALLRSAEGSRDIPARIVSMAVLRAAPSTIADFGDTPSDSSVRVRAMALDLAGQLNLVDARRVIEAGLSSPSEVVRLASIRSLQRLGSPLSLPALQAMATYSAYEHSHAQIAIYELQAE
ncbi:HEAT repeat domain-containing protein [Salinibacterium sp. SWN1162]|uniref:HEAT repeat domain-containing protein n=1 Tax=Salinibacterium sp. SWN1162 TaxID=2792053 RepID=UPI0018CD8F89|nr:HEAT repeat domain-containing protein [Salinibacterium sp. SWN1162]MBH0008044.1 HEAT repeat domain-containing protein [Salinibacterium sp. SWN1162]